jgi:hypothetical protein
MIVTILKGPTTPTPGTSDDEACAAGFQSVYVLVVILSGSPISTCSFYHYYLLITSNLGGGGGGWGEQSINLWSNLTRFARLLKELCHEQ